MPYNPNQPRVPSGSPEGGEWGSVGTTILGVRRPTDGDLRGGVQSRAFKNWFGDWKNDPDNASKVTDADGKPMVVFHGSQKEFDEFKGGFPTLGKLVGPGHYFTEDENDAEWWAKGGPASFDKKANAVVMPVYLNARKPLDLTGNDALENLIATGVPKGIAEDFINNPAESDQLEPFLRYQKSGNLFKSLGFDSVKYEYEGKTHWVVFDSIQIKSAANVGTFDPNNPNIKL